MSEYLNAWNLKEKDFPSDGSLEDKLLFCVQYAVLSPSTYNTQPWFFRVGSDYIDIYADRRYGLPVIDPDDRMLELSCGSTLYCLCIALRNFGFVPNIELLPDSDNSDLMARVGVEFNPDKAILSVGEKELFNVITKRHGSRSVFTDKNIDAVALHKLQKVVEEHDSWLHICDDDEKKQIFQMVAEADAVQASSKPFRRELAAWVHPMRKYSGDGMPHYNMGFKEVMGDFTPSVIRRFDMDGKKVGVEEMMEATPILAVIGANKTLSKGRLSCGEAYMHMGLQAEVLRISLSSLGQVTEVPDLRLRLHDVIDCHGRAHLVLRMGYTKSKTYTPRRSLSQVVEFVGGRKIDVSKYNNCSGTGFFGKIGKLFLAK